MFGLLNVDKPAGVTSRDVVNRVERIVRPLKVGHAGTLDPLATGVLVIGLGQATRLVEYVQRMRKTYQGTFLLGRTSDTEDIEGQVVELAEFRVPTREDLETAIPRFVGTIEQRPPTYSALKVSGRRAYKMARRGENVELEPRAVAIHALQVERYDYPELELLVECGSGTYIRSLGRDLAEAVGTGAVMSQLRRLAIGPFRVAEAIQADELDFAVIQTRLRSPLLALGELPVVSLSDEEIVRVSHGQVIANRCDQQAAEIAAVNGSSQLAAILIQAGDGLLRPTKCFVA